jgi:hypothetical protein
MKPLQQLLTNPQVGKFIETFKFNPINMSGEMNHIINNNKYYNLFNEIGKETLESIEKTFSTNIEESWKKRSLSYKYYNSNNINCC